MVTTSPDRTRSGRRRARRRGRGIAVAALSAVGLVALLAGGAVLVVREGRAGVLPGVELAGMAVGGLDETTLRRTVAALAARRADQRVTVLRPGVPGAPETAARRSAPAGELGYELDVDATVDAVLARGRQANVLRAAADHLQAFRGTTAVRPVQRVDAVAADRWVRATARAFALEPREGSVGFDGVTVTRADPVPGLRVDTQALAAQVREALLVPGPATIEAPVTPVPPVTTVADVDAAAAEAARAVDGPVTLRRGDAAITFTPVQIAGVLRLGLGPDGTGMIWTPDVDAVTAAAGDVAALETPPVDARVRLEGTTVVIDPSAEGFRYDPDRAAAQLYELAVAEGPAEAELDGVVAEPARTTAEAEALQIREPVGTFTTEFPAGQSRVTNIRRISELVDGVVLAPGETFSVNDHVGERTPDKGFVGGGAIQQGESVEEVGGGVSQFATTLYNAAYFAGLDLVEYKAHSQYFSRYPVGREATLNYPNVDLVIGNPSPYGVLVDTASSETSVTVTMWSTKWVEVESVTSDRYAYTEPRTITRPNPALPPGTTRVVQGGGGTGFSVTDTRILRYLNGRTESEERVTVYEAAPRIVERGT